MFSQKRFSLFIIFFVLLVMVEGSLRADFIHDCTIPELDFTDEPEITCSIDGWTFTHTKITDENGNVEQDWWWRVPEDPVFKIEATAHGYGWAHIIFHGKYDVSKGEKKYGDPKNSQDKKLGKSVGFVPFFLGVDHDIEVEYDGTFSESPAKTYNWEGHGTITLIPWYWKWNLAFVILTGSWEPAPNDNFHKELTDMSAGSWVVNHNHKDRRKKPQIRPPEDDNGGSSGSPNIVLSPSDGTSMVTAGSSYTLNLSVPSGYTRIHWYIKGPSDAGYGTTAATETGNGSSSTSASYTYSIPSDASGEYVLTAYIYLADNTIAEPSYTVSVSNSGTSSSDSSSSSGSELTHWCPWCSSYYDPNNNYPTDCRGFTYHDGFPSP
ncbi:MAG: hypothetical protein OXI43_01325 [Candidatus Poribacteria bacterium]|nr:hypothetical protein [Candidatus Poribacteria bacterium]